MKSTSDQQLIDQFLRNHPDLAVDVIEGLAFEEIALLLEDMPIENSRVILSNMAPYKAGRVLEKVTSPRSLEILEQLPIEEAEAILRAVDPIFRDKMLDALPEELSTSLRTTLSFHKKQVGAHSSSLVLTLFENWSVAKAVEALKKYQELTKPALFVLTKERRLVGYLEANQLFAHEGEQLVSSIMKRAPKPYVATMLLQDALEHWNDAFAELPVVKGNGQFLGVISRAIASKMGTAKLNPANLEIKAGNALGDLYLIGLTSLLGSPDDTRGR